VAFTFSKELTLAFTNDLPGLKRQDALPAELKWRLFYSSAFTYPGGKSNKELPLL
jgi:hypothetical protein